MNRLTEQLEVLDTKLDVFENATSDKRWNNARRAVLRQWDAVVEVLEDWDEDEDEATYCDDCGCELDYDEGAYCEECYDQMFPEDEGDDD